MTKISPSDTTTNTPPTGGAQRRMTMPPSIVSILAEEYPVIPDEAFNVGDFVTELRNKGVEESVDRARDHLNKLVKDGRLKLRVFKHKNYYWPTKDD
jgi:hypothetical protein